MHARSLIRWIECVIVLLIVSVTPEIAFGQQKQFQGVKLVVNGFGGNLDEVLVENVSKPLYEQYGITVQMVPGSVASAYAKLVTCPGRTPRSMC